MTTVDSELTETADAQQLAYARFTRRVRAAYIDVIILILMLFGALFVAVTFRSDGFSREIGFGLIALLVLYEPVLVSLTGGTIGHFRSNLRVVDDRTQGNISFLKALARFVIKTTLSWYSFITMATTRRHQAVHDLLTGSTVQIRDIAEASPGHYVHERIELSHPGMPSRARRTLVIFAYLLVSVVVLWLVLAGVLSRACLIGDHCTSHQVGLFNLVSLFWLVSCVLAVVWGWRGRLPGCRARQAS